MALNKETKEQWLEALRSGQYEQGKSVLKGDSSTGHEKTIHCCLGVLAEVTGDLTYQNEDLCYMVYVGTDDKTSSYYYGNDEVGRFDKSWGIDLAEYNDNGMSFNEIADKIEENSEI